MAVSKRTRFEVLRRDGNACRYCGGMAPDVRLTIDHVVPVALGGGDDPTNLVTACRDCNAGKTSTAPDQELVAEVSASAIRWAEAMRVAGQAIVEQNRPTDEYVEKFNNAWLKWRTHGGSGDHIDRPGGWREAVADLYRAQLPESVMLTSVDIAMSARGVDNEFSYFMGVCRNRLREQSAIAEALLAREDNA